MGNGPLADSRLQEIESKLNAGRFDEAQRLLSTIGNLPNAETASAYFATRLLFQRGRMDQQGVILRLRELLARVPEFPEAARMLAAAEAGVLAPAPDVFRRVTGAPSSEPPENPEPAPCADSARHSTSTVGAAFHTAHRHAELCAIDAAGAALRHTRGASARPQPQQHDARRGTPNHRSEPTRCRTPRA